MRRWLILIAAFVAATSTGIATAAPEAEKRIETDSREYIVLAVDNPSRTVPTHAGSSLPSYRTPRYVVGSKAKSILAAIEHEHHLNSAAEWPIMALGLHCVVYAVPSAVDREALLQTLTRDKRVRLVQPLQDFSTLASADAGEAAGVQYNDPYVDMQRGFVQTAAAQAHRVSTGSGVEVAVVDTGVDRRHPDLQGRIANGQDLVGAAGVSTFEQERHGTEVSGIIAAAANNQQGIVGIAPNARLNVYRACWYPKDGSTARCNSFTLAKALAAVLDSKARIVNLSLGGPSDPLLETMVRKLLEQHRVVVGSLPPSGRKEGFPAGVPGVIVVGNAGVQPAAQGVVYAPGRDVLTLTPGGRYDFASGSSISAAHASGIAALLLAIEPQLDGVAVQRLLAGSMAADSTASINAEWAVDALTQRMRLASAQH